MNLEDLKIIELYEKLERMLLEDLEHPINVAHGALMYFYEILGAFDKSWRLKNLHLGIIARYEVNEGIYLCLVNDREGAEIWILPPRKNHPEEGYQVGYDLLTLHTVGVTKDPRELTSLVHDAFQHLAKR